jgi:GrpB-like predicted nucleotidyltransferase (UPF0157 family)
MSLGLESGIVRVVGHDPAWAGLFAEEAHRLRHALTDDLAIALEHVGSTAVQGLAAKPVLDVLGGYPADASVDRYIRALVAAGYVHRGELGIPGRQYFRRGDPCSHHLHLAVIGGSFWREHLAFRDALRADAALRQAYAELKVELARRFPRDREAYTNGKSEFIRRAVARALGGADM